MDKSIFSSNNSSSEKDEKDEKNEKSSNSSSSSSSSNSNDEKMKNENIDTTVSSEESINFDDNDKLLEFDQDDDKNSILIKKLKLVVIIFVIFNLFCFMVGVMLIYVKYNYNPKENSDDDNLVTVEIENLLNINETIIFSFKSFIEFNGDDDDNYLTNFIQTINNDNKNDIDCLNITNLIGNNNINKNNEFYLKDFTYKNDNNFFNFEKIDLSILRENYLHENNGLKDDLVISDYYNNCLDKNEKNNTVTFLRSYFDSYYWSNNIKEYFGEEIRYSIGTGNVLSLFYSFELNNDKNELIIKPPNLIFNFLNEENNEFIKNKFIFNNIYIKNYDTIKSNDTDLFFNGIYNSINEIVRSYSFNSIDEIYKLENDLILKSLNYTSVEEEQGNIKFDENDIYFDKNDKTLKCSDNYNNFCTLILTPLLKKLNETNKFIDNPISIDNLIFKNTNYFKLINQLYFINENFNTLVLKNYFKLKLFISIMHSIDLNNDKVLINYFNWFFKIVDNDFNFIKSNDNPKSYCTKFIDWDLKNLIKHNIISESNDIYYEEKKEFYYFLKDLVSFEIVNYFNESMINDITTNTIENISNYLNNELELEFIDSLKKNEVYENPQYVQFIKIRSYFSVDFNENNSNNDFNLENEETFDKFLSNPGENIYSESFLNWLELLILQKNQYEKESFFIYQKGDSNNKDKLFVSPEVFYNYDYKVSKDKETNETEVINLYGLEFTGFIKLYSRINLKLLEILNNEFNLNLNELNDKNILITTNFINYFFGEDQNLIDLYNNSSNFKIDLKTFNQILLNNINCKI